MAFWHESNFLSNFKNHIVKWYRLVILPVFHIDNSGSKQRFHTEGEEKESGNNNLSGVSSDAAGSFSDAAGSANNKNVNGAASGTSVTMPAQNKKGPVASGDAAAVLDRINNDREGRHLDEVERARKKAEEDARLASIMNANKVDVDSFIAQGKSAAEEAKAAEEMRRAQEIIDRLNSEAAADEAAKQAEIEAAKKQAMEQENLTAANNSDADDEATEEMRRAQEIIDRLNREAAEDEAAKQAELDAAMAEAAAKFGE